MSELTASANPIVELDFDAAQKAVVDTVNANLQNNPQVFFVTPNLEEGQTLFQLFLAELPESARDHHNCRTCREFINKYGNLVSVNPDTGAMKSLMWDETTVEPGFKEAFAKLRKVIECRSVTGVFYPDTGEVTLGFQNKGDWSHFYVDVKKMQKMPVSYKGAYANVAKHKEDFRLFAQSIGEFQIPVLEKALQAMKSDKRFSGKDKFISELEIYVDARKTLAAIKDNRLRNNMIWSYVVTKPVGVVLFGQTVVGQFVANILNKNFESATYRFLEDTKGENYRRPVEAPSAGNIAEGERVIRELGLETALARRQATLSDIPVWVWKTPVDEVKSEGVFGHLKPKQEVKDSPLVVDGGVINWVKFARDVLPTVEKLQCVLGSGYRNFTGLTTAVDPEAGPLIKWDSEEHRNPVSFWSYVGGSPANKWGLDATSTVNIVGITKNPAHWGYNPSNQFGESTILLLENANPGTVNTLALFPEVLRAELHPVRATIESFSNAGRLDRVDNAAAGVMIAPAGNIQLQITATKGGVVTRYLLDRWE